MAYFYVKPAESLVAYLAFVDLGSDRWVLGLDVTRPCRLVGENDAYVVFQPAVVTDDDVVTKKIG